MASNKDITDKGSASTVAICLRIPPDIYDAVRTSAWKSKMTAQATWIAAIRKYLGLPASDSRQARSGSNRKSA